MYLKRSLGLWQGSYILLSKLKTRIYKVKFTLVNYVYGNGKAETSKIVSELLSVDVYEQFFDRTKKKHLLYTNPCYEWEL